VCNTQPYTTSYSFFSAGPGGCALAQTLVNGGLFVLVVERGGEPPEVSRNIVNSEKALISKECVEVFNSQPQGVRLSAGKCMGGRVV